MRPPPWVTTPKILPLIAKSRASANLICGWSYHV